MPKIGLSKHRTTVLLVDDQPIVGKTVGRMLSTEKDIDFHYCQDPLDAIGMAIRILPTVILQDLIMPEVDGLTLVRYFRANASTRDVPLIVLSSKQEAQVKAEAFALGANDYMVKLPDPVEMIARIRYHSKGYINLLERNEAYKALLESQKLLRSRNRFIRRTFGRYLSDEIVDSILESPEGMKLGGEKRKVTIMMADLRGFSSMAEGLPAENVVGIINIYLEVMTEVILKYLGTIDEFIGDAILVVFGAPVQRVDDARRAVACGIAMQLAMEEVNRRNRESGYPAMAMGIGINTGRVVVGNIGSKRRTKYAVVGHHVNLTSRIESYSLGGQILISESTREECGPILRIDDRMSVMPRGVREPITVHQVGGIGGEYGLFLPIKEDTRLLELGHPLEVKFVVPAGRHANVMEGHRGRIVRMFKDAAEIHAEVMPHIHENLRITLLDESAREVASDVYAKVTGCLSASPPAFQVNFTFVPPEAELFLQEAAIPLRRES
jgi:adenylate cyclase